MNSAETVRLLGIDFFNGEPEQVVDQLKSGGMLVVPAAPALATIMKDRQYYNALRAADMAIPDSGYMVLICKIFRGKNLRKISGWKFLVTFLADKDIVAEKKILLVDPRPVEAAANLAYLRGRGFDLNESNSYLAPLYPKDKVTDPELLDLIVKTRPRYIIINLGGGVQEKLGAYLKQNLPYRPAIICTGAAIAFLTGHQAEMPVWADNLYLGWLMRCIQKPSVYVPRYLRAFKLILLMLRYGQRAPY